jgi:glucose-1-phosphate thymidylyltransferase
MVRENHNGLILTLKFILLKKQGLTMDAVILCGGFAKRMWPLTKEVPKALLEVRGKPLLEHIMDRLEEIDEVERVFISVNRRFRDQLILWFMEYNSKKHVELVVEPSMREEEKLGSIGAWGFLIREEKLDRDLLSISGDNFFDFGLRPLLDFYKRTGETAIGVFDAGKEEAGRFGIVEMGPGNRIVGFEEKPERPKSTLASTGIYVFPREVLGMVLRYLEGGNSPDKAGMFLKWLYKLRPVYGFLFSGEWADIGSMDTYERLRDGGRKSEGPEA